MDLFFEKLKNLGLGLRVTAGFSLWRPFKILDRKCGNDRGAGEVEILSQQVNEVKGADRD